MDAIDDILSSDFAFILTFMRTDGLAQFRDLLQKNRTAFENLTYITNDEDVVAEDGKAAAYWTMTGKHVGEWSGIKATNRDVSIEGITFFKLRDGKIYEAKVHNNVLGLRRQLGAA